MRKSRARDVPRWGLAIALIMAGATGGTPAWAGPTRAEALFQEGKEAAKAGDYATACPRFEESFRLDPAKGTLLNVADCAENLGKRAYALERFKQALLVLDAADPRRPRALAKVAELTSILPKLTVRVRGYAQDVTLRLDGVSVAIADATNTPIDVGHHVVALQDRSGKVRETAIDVRERDVREVELDAGDAEPARPTGAVPLTPPAAEDRSTSPVGIGFLVGGVVAAGVGATFGILALQQRSTYQDHCPTQTTCDAQGIDAARHNKTSGLVADFTLPIGLVLLGVGTYLTFHRPKGPGGARLEARTLPGTWTF